LQYFGVRYEATVAEEPLYDPGNLRLRGASALTPASPAAPAETSGRQPTTVGA
jgi:hypothetical protein